MEGATKKKKKEKAPPKTKLNNRRAKAAAKSGLQPDSPSSEVDESAAEDLLLGKLKKAVRRRLTATTAPFPSVEDEDVESIDDSCLNCDDVTLAAALLSSFQR